MAIIDSQVHVYDATTRKRPWHRVPNVEARTLHFDEVVEAALSQQLTQPTIEGMTRSRRQVRRRHPHRGLAVAFRLPIDMGEV
jgi:hypothetical protein